jgi:16S rRNA C1402 (ribose-2'-O) methylase RsmI
MKKSEQTAIKERRRFDAAFKREAINHWVASGKSAAVICGKCSAAGRPSVSDLGNRLVVLPHTLLSTSA